MSFERQAERALAGATAARTNIAHILSWSLGRTLDELRSETLVRYAIERAFIVIDAALRDIPGQLIVKHEVPARLVADFRNVLAHSYEDILDVRVIASIRNDLPVLDASLGAIISELESGA